MREIAEDLYSEIKSICRLELQQTSLKRGSSKKIDFSQLINTKTEILRSRIAGLSSGQRRLLEQHIQSLIDPCRSSAEQILTLESLLALLRDPKNAVVPATPGKLYMALFMLEFGDASESKRSALSLQLSSLSLPYREMASRYIMRQWSHVPRVKQFLTLLQADLPVESRDHAA